MKRFRPSGNKFLVEIDPDTQETESGLIVGVRRVERDKVLFGTVLEVGPDVQATDEIAVGRRVAVPYCKGWVIQNERGRELVVFKEDPEFVYFTAPAGELVPKTVSYGPRVSGRL